MFRCGRTADARHTAQSAVRICATGDMRLANGVGHFAGNITGSGGGAEALAIRTCTRRRSTATTELRKPLLSSGLRRFGANSRPTSAQLSGIRPAQYRPGWPTVTDAARPAEREECQHSD